MSPQSQSHSPLCVDLDGTLIASDSLHEAIAVASRDLPALLGAFLLLLHGKGKAAFKRSVYAIAELDVSKLPFDRHMTDYIRAARDQGRQIFLVTAADRLIADAVFSQTGLFDGVICSDGTSNIRGKAKAKALAERFGPGGFTYAGNDYTDLHVWKAAGAAILVNTPARLARRVEKIVPVEARWNRPFSPASLLKAMRPHQWAKNVLVFVAIIASTQLGDLRGWLSDGVLFVSMCCAASAIYILNDLVDLNSDRNHDRNRERPFARGALSVRTGAITSMALAIVALAISAGIGALPLVCGYMLISAAYSFYLKEKPLLDVFILAGLYTIRIYAGGMVSGHYVTEWLAGFSIFFFLSLALAKRVTELAYSRKSGRTGNLRRRGYSTDDIGILQTIGVASAFAAALVLSLYFQGLRAKELYSNPEWLVLVVICALFWLCRAWLKTSRGEMDKDPVVWAMSDNVSRGLAVIVVIAMLAAMGSFRW